MPVHNNMRPELNDIAAKRPEVSGGLWTCHIFHSIRLAGHLKKGCKIIRLLKVSCYCARVVLKDYQLYWSGTRTRR